MSLEVAGKGNSRCRKKQVKNRLVIENSMYVEFAGKESACKEMASKGMAGKESAAMEIAGMAGKESGR